MSDPEQRPERAIVDFHRDEEGDWVADLACGHTQHVRHNPPWVNRPWVTTAAGRASFLGRSLRCRDCAVGAAAEPNHHRGTNSDHHQ